MEDLNYKILRRKHRYKSSRIWIRQWFLTCDTKAQAKKKKVDEPDLIKFKSFCALKHTIKKVK